MSSAKARCRNCSTRNFQTARFPIGDQNDCNTPYIERVHISIDQGRVHVAGHLAGRVGKKLPVVGCVSLGDASDFSVSGTPVASGSVLKLSGINLRTRSRRGSSKTSSGPLLRKLCWGRRPIRLEAASSECLEGGAPPYQVALDNLLLQTITAQDKALTVDIDFKLSVQSDKDGRASFPLIAVTCAHPEVLVAPRRPDCPFSPHASHDPLRPKPDRVSASRPCLFRALCL